MIDRDEDRGWLKLSRVELAEDVRLICLPWAGAGASGFWPLAHRLGSSVEVFAYQPPGRESRIRGALSLSLDGLVEDFLLKTRELRSRPFGLLGHSFGAMVAYEAALRICGGGDALPEFVIASGCAGPAAKSSQADISQLPEAEFVTACAAYGGLPEEILGNAELMRLILPGLRSDCRMAEHWRTAKLAALPKPLPVPLVAVAGAADPFVPKEGLQAWLAVAGSDFSFRQFAGGHFYLSENCPGLVNLISDLAFASSN